MKLTALSVLLFFLIISPRSHAQSLTEADNNLKWADMSGWQSALKLPGNNSVMLMQPTKKLSRIVCVDEKGTERWKLDIKEKERKESVLGIAKFHGNIIVFVMNNIMNHPTLVNPSRIDAIVVDAGKGTIIQEKTIITLDGKLYAVPWVIRNPQGELQSVTIRHTRWDGEISFALKRIETEMSQTKKIEVYTLSKDLESTMAHEYGINPDVFYYGHTAHRDGILLLWLNRNLDIVLEQFKGDGVEARMTLPIDWDKKTNFDFAMLASPHNPSELIFSIRYTQKKVTHLVALINLADQSFKSFTETLGDNEYRKYIEANAVTFDGSKIAIREFSFRQLSVSGFDFLKDDRIMVITEIGTPSANPGWHGDAIITILDKEMKVLKHLYLQKAHRDLLAYHSVAFNNAGDKLQLITSDAYDASYFIIFGEIDLKNLQWTKVVKVKQGNREKFGDPVIAGYPIWLEKNVLIWFRGGGMKSVSYN